MDSLHQVRIETQHPAELIFHHSTANREHLVQIKRLLAHSWRCKIYFEDVDAPDHSYELE